MLSVCKLPQFKINLKVFDRKTKEMIHDHTEDGHSWVRNAYSMAFAITSHVYEGTDTYGVGYYALKNIDGGVQGNPVWWSTSYISHETVGQGSFGAAGDNTRGIVVGTGDTAWTFNDYKLATKILNGSTTGKLEYSVTNAYVKTWNSPTWTIETSRYLDNNSGDTITVKEVGLDQKSNFSYLLARDVLGTPVAIPDDGQLLVTYSFTQTLPV